MSLTTNTCTFAMYPYCMESATLNDMVPQLDLPDYAHMCNTYLIKDEAEVSSCVQYVPVIQPKERQYALEALISGTTGPFTAGAATFATYDYQGEYVFLVLHNTSEVRNVLL